MGSRKRLPWDVDTVQAASENGHAEVVQWALANGCPNFDGGDTASDLDDEMEHSDDEVDEDDYYGDDFDDDQGPGDDMD